MKIFGKDPDEVLQYHTPKIVVVKDAKLGCLLLSLKLAIFCYIFIWMILYQGAHLMRRDIEGVFRVTLRHPTKDLCDPFLIGCEANFTPMSALPYCSESAAEYATPGGQEAKKRPCQFWDYVESGMPVDGGIFVPTRVRRFQQKRGCVPSEANGWQCNDNGNVLYNFEDVAHGGLQTASEGTFGVAAPLYDIYVGDVEHFTVLLDHGIRDAEGLQENDFSMNGDWLDCPSAATPSAECKRHRVVCGHSQCPGDSVTVGDADAEALKAEQQKALSGASALFGSLGSRRLRPPEATRVRPQPGHQGHLDVEDAAVGGPAVGFQRSGYGLLPGSFEGFPVAANRIGDIFDLGSVIKMAGLSMDDLAGSGIKGTRRENGMVMVIQIEYTNTHMRSWLGLRITPFNEPPQPTYTYRVFTTAANAYQMTKTFNDPADSSRIIRVYNGLRIVVEQSGNIASWSIAKFLVTLTAAMGMLAVATTLTELIMLNLLARKEEYKNTKFYETEDMNPDAAEDDETEDCPSKTDPEMVQKVTTLMAKLEAGKKNEVCKALDDILHHHHEKRSKA